MNIAQCPELHRTACAIPNFQSSEKFSKILPKFTTSFPPRTYAKLTPPVLLKSAQRHGYI